MFTIIEYRSVSFYLQPLSGYTGTRLGWSGFIHMLKVCYIYISLYQIPNETKNRPKYKNSI